MTDNDIIKALECCSGIGKCMIVLVFSNYCPNCGAEMKGEQ